MQLRRFLRPKFMGFALRNAWHGCIDKFTGKPGRPLQTVPYVASYANPGDPPSVLATLDRFAREERWLMSVGPEKRQVMQEVAARLPENPRVLEFGAYCGYSSIMIADIFGAGATVTSVEISAESVEAATANVAHAGLGAQIEFVNSGSSEAIPDLEGPYHLVFLDHWKPLYLDDLKSIEAHRLIEPGSIVVADNVGEIFEADEYLDYVRNSGSYDCENLPATIEYTDLPDAVEISILR